MYVYVIGVSSGILCLGRERIDYVKQTAPRLGVLPQEILEILNNGLIKRDLVLGKFPLLANFHFSYGYSYMYMYMYYSRPVI